MNALEEAAMRTKRRPKDDPEQSRLFIEKAREFGADEEKSAADELIWRPPQTHKEPKRERK